MDYTRDLLFEVRRVSDLAEIVEATGHADDFTGINKTGTFRGKHLGHGNRDGCTVNARLGYWKCFVCGEGGDVIGWVHSVRYGRDPDKYRDAVIWLANYYNIPVLDEPIDMPQVEAHETLTSLSWQWHEELLERGDKIDWIRNKWGLTEDTIKALRLGYCPGVDLATCGFTKEQLIGAGVLDTAGNQSLIGRIIFPYLKNGLVVWMSGRLPSDQTGIVKYQALNSANSNVHPTLYNFDNAIAVDRKTPLVFTEGLPDAARAHQEGIAAVAVGGAQAFTTAMHADAVELLRHCDDHKYIIFDTEESKAGFRGACDLARELIRFGYDPFIVQLPLGEEAHVDLCEYLNKEGVYGLTLLIERALRGTDDSSPATLGYMLIDECPKQAESERIKSILLAVAPLDDVVITKYIDAIAKKTHSSTSEIKKVLDVIRKRQLKVTREVDTDYEEAPYYAQDFTYYADLDLWRAHTCVYVPHVERKVKYDAEEEASVCHVVHIATDMGADGNYRLSKVDVLANPDNDMLNKIPVREILRDKDNLWSVKPTKPYSYLNFISDKTPRIEVGKLYERVYNMFKKYVWLPDERDHHVLALYVFLTYIYMGLDAIPYLHVNGKRDAGKSTILNLLGTLSFNAATSSTMTPSVLFRVAHSTRPTFIIDEAEQLKRPQIGTMAYEIAQLANGSYTKDSNACAYRCNRDSLEPERYFTYSPKVFGSINRIISTLSSRSIIIHCMTAPATVVLGLGDWEVDKIYNQEDIQDIRDQLRVWALTQFRGVREEYDRIKRKADDFMLTRDRQIWRSILALAKLIGDNAGQDLSSVMLDLAQAKQQTLQTNEALNDFPHMILLTLCKLWETSPDDGGRYVSARTGQEYLCASIAVKALKQRMMEEQLWVDNFTKLDAAFVLNQLRAISAVPDNKRPTTALLQGAKRDVYPFHFETLKKYLESKGAFGEDTGTNADHNADDLAASTGSRESLYELLDGRGAGHRDDGSTMAQIDAGDLIG